MGLDVNAVRFILEAKARGVSFDRVATIGRQTLFIDVDTLARTLEAYHIPVSRQQVSAMLTDSGGFCEALLQFLGAKQVCSIDMSPYQSATVLHDMNRPLLGALKNQFSVVIDGGSLEHVFNFPQAIANCIEMLRVGGHYLASSPSNNFMGHGFYQFSPELFYRVFSRANGFEMERMVVYQECWPYVWYDVRDPEQLGARVTLVNRYPTYLLVQSRKVDSKPLFEPVPQQSDYVNVWQRSAESVTAPSPPQALATQQPATLSRRIGVLIGTLLPEALKVPFRRLRVGRDPFDRRFYEVIERRDGRSTTIGL